MDTYFDKLLGQYDKLYNEAVYGKGHWKQKTKIVACVLFAVSSLIMILTVAVSMLFPSSSEMIEHILDISLVPSVIGLGVLLVFKCTEDNDFVSTETLKTWPERLSGCKIKKVENTYDVFLRNLSTARDTTAKTADDTEIGCIKLLPRNAPPLLLSLRGKDGPVGRPTLTQNFRLIDGTDDKSTRNDSMPAISRYQFNHLPDTVTLSQLNVELFPDWLDPESPEEEPKRWVFTVADPNAQDELKAALDTLEKTVLKILIIESLENTIRKNRPLEYEFCNGKYEINYDREDDLIRILNGGNTGSPYAEEVRDLVDKVEAIAASDRPLIGADAPLKLEIATA